MDVTLQPTIINTYYIVYSNLFRKALLVFPEDTKEFIEKEIEDFTELEIKVIGTCCTKLNKQKATLLVNKRRKIKDIKEDELLLEMSRKY